MKQLRLLETDKNQQIRNLALEAICLISPPQQSHSPLPLQPYSPETSPKLTYRWSPEISLHASLPSDATRDLCQSDSTDKNTLSQSRSQSPDSTPEKASCVEAHDIRSSNQQSSGRSLFQRAPSPVPVLNDVESEDPVIAREGAKVLAADGDEDCQHIISSHRQSEGQADLWSAQSKTETPLDVVRRPLQPIQGNSNNIHCSKSGHGLNKIHKPVKWVSSFLPTKTRQVPYVFDLKLPKSHQLLSERWQAGCH